MQKKMGQTADYIRDNIVKIADENGNCVGTGFFIHKEYCITCHHNIYGLDEIYVEREKYNNETGQARRLRYHAEWVEQFSHMQRDVAILKVKGSIFKPLQYGRETYGKMPVAVKGFPLEGTDQYPDGKHQSGTLSDIVVRLPWKEEEVQEKRKKWNMKPKVNVQVFAFSASSTGAFELGFSGAPVYYEHDGTVVGMFEAIDSSKGYIIPMHLVIEKFDLEKGKKVSTPSPTLDTRNIITKGNEYHYKHEYARAIELYQTILNDPNYASALNNMGTTLYELGNYDEAIKYHCKALEMQPNNVSTWFNKGSDFSILGRYKEAIDCYDRAIEMQPNNADVLNNKGLDLDHLGRYKEAIDCYDRAIEINPNHINAWSNKGYTLNNLGRYEEALKYFDKELEINPNHFFACSNKGYAFDHLGRYKEAIDCYDRAIEINPNNAIAWSSKGATLNNLGRYEEALKYFDKALEMQPNYITAWNNKGYALGNLGKHKEAIACYDKTLEIAPNNVLALNNKGLALHHLGKYKSALVSYNKALKIDPNYAAAWHNKGMVALHNLRRYKEAIKYFDKALKIDPNYAVSLNNKALALHNLHRYKEAIKYFDKALKIDPNDPNAQFLRACSRVRKGDTEHGLADLTKAIEIDKKFIKLAKQNKDFESMRNNERFKALVMQ